MKHIRQLFTSAALLSVNVGFFAGAVVHQPASAEFGDCQPEPGPDQSPYCACLDESSPGAGDGQCLEFTVPIEVDCFRDYHCNVT